jgi:predicted dehydrogenase
MKKVKVGVIGVGYLGKYHAEKYAGIADVQLMGVVDANAGCAEEIAGKLKTSAYTDPVKLIGMVDAVSIVVPTILHHSIAKQFLEKGIHVLLEKPITVTLEQADELNDLAESKGLILQVGHIERFNPAVTAVKSLLTSPRYMIAERAAPFTSRCTDVNVILDLMIHDLDIVLDLAGSVPKELNAAGVSVITKEIDIATVRIVFQSGCIADITASRISDEKKRLLRIVDGGSVYTSDYQSQKASVSKRGADPASALTILNIPTTSRDTLDEEVRSFVQSVQSGARPLVSGIEGRRALALARTIADSIEKGITGFVPVP